MRRRWLAVAIVMLAVFGMAGRPVSARAEIIDRILAIVDAQIITLSDVRAALKFDLVQADVTTDPVGAALQRLIDRRLMLAEVDRYAPPEPPNSEIDARVAALERRYADVLAFEIALTTAGLTREELRRQFPDTLRIQSYLQQRFATAVQPDDTAQRAAFVTQWVEGLRRRGAVQLLYLPGAK